MTDRRPIISINGVEQELKAPDLIAADILPVSNATPTFAFFVS